MEKNETDLIEVSDTPEKAEENLEIDLEMIQSRRKEDDLSSKPLTGKMIYLMQKISEYGYLSMPEVQMIYGNQTHAYKVLGVLKEKNLIDDFPTERMPKKAYYLKPKGYRMLEKFGKLRLKRRFLAQHFMPFIFNHRLACARVGIILESHPLIKDFMPESLLWERAVERCQKLCDGEFDYKVPGYERAERVGLEVELSLKNRDKLDESLLATHKREDLAQVWWICGDDAILRALKAENLHWHWENPQRHFFCRLEDFMAAKHQARLYDSEGAEFKIDPAGPTLRPLPLQKAAADQPIVRAEVISQPKPERPSWGELKWQLEDARHEILLLEREIERLQTPPKVPRRSPWRWVLPIFGGCIVVGLAAYLFLKMPSGPPEEPWIARTILNTRAIENLRGTWVVKQIALHSRGDNYWLSLELYLPNGFWCGLKGVTVMDPKRQVLSELKIKGGEWIYAHHSWEGDFEFQAPHNAKVLLGIVSDGWGCGNMEFPVVHN